MAQEKDLETTVPVVGVQGVEQPTAADPLTKADARPWTIYDRMADGDPPWPLYDGEYCCIESADRSADWVAVEVLRNANAELIVRAVNEYEALLAVETEARRLFANDRMAGLLREFLGQLDTLRQSLSADTTTAPQSSPISGSGSVSS